MTFLFPGIRPAPAEGLGALCPPGRVLLFLRVAHHGLCVHDACAHRPLRAPGGGRQPQAGDDDLCPGCGGLRRVHHLRRRALFPAEIPGDGRFSGPGGLPGPAGAGAAPGSGGDRPGELRRRRAFGLASGWALWSLFRLFLVDSQEMVLSFDPEAYIYALAFAAYVTGMLFFLGGRSIRKTNIMDVVQESHKSEPIPGGAPVVWPGGHWPPGPWGAFAAISRRPSLCGASTGIPGGPHGGVLSPGPGGALHASAPHGG